MYISSLLYKSDLLALHITSLSLVTFSLVTFVLSQLAKPRALILQIFIDGIKILYIKH